MAGEQCSPLQEFFDILSNTQSPSRVRPGRALWFQEAYSRSSVSIKCTGSMMRTPSALGAAGVKRESGKRSESPVFGIARREFAKIY